MSLERGGRSGTRSDFLTHRLKCRFTFQSGRKVDSSPSRRRGGGRDGAG